MKNKIRVALILYIIFLGFQGVVFAADIMPHWNTGEKWLVKAVYSSLPGTNKWSAPIIWEYVVKEQGEIESVECYILEIKKYNSSPEAVSKLYYRLSDLSLIKAEIIKIRRGKKYIVDIKYNGGTPVQTEQTLTPYDWPIFPLKSSSSTEYIISKNIGQGLKTAISLTQETENLSRIEAFPDWPGDIDIIKIRCINEKGFPVFTQYWKKNYPWPIYGETENMKYWLVIGDDKQ